MISSQPQLQNIARSIAQYNKYPENFLYFTPTQKINFFFSQFKTYQYKKRALIINKEEPLGSVFYVKNGYLRAYKISEQGDELTLAILKPQDLFPFSFGISSLPSNDYYLEALTALELWKVPRDLFFNFTKNNTDVYCELAEMAVAKLGGVLARMEYLIMGTAYTKVSSIILISAKQFGEEKYGQLVIKLPLTHKDISTLVGITRETVCLEVRKLEKKGIISHTGRFLRVNDLERLKEEALLTDKDDQLLKYSL